MVIQRAHSAFVQVVADVEKVVTLVLRPHGAAGVACEGSVGKKWVVAAAAAAAVAAEVQNDPCVYVAQEVRLAAQMLLIALRPQPNSGILGAAAQPYSYKPRHAVAHTRFLQAAAVAVVTVRLIML